MYRVVDGQLQVLLAHPGGPRWEHKDIGIWSIPKGEIKEDEDKLLTAIREFKEETGFEPHGPYIYLGSVVQKSGKIVYVWAFEGDCDPKKSVSNTFEMEWPPHSGIKKTFPEIDRVAFFPVKDALIKVNPAQAPLILELERILKEKDIVKQQNQTPQDATDIPANN